MMIKLDEGKIFAWSTTPPNFLTQMLSLDLSAVADTFLFLIIVFTK